MRDQGPGDPALLVSGGGPTVDPCAYAGRISSASHRTPRQWPSAANVRLVASKRCRRYPGVGPRRTGNDPFSGRDSPRGRTVYPSRRMCGTMRENRTSSLCNHLFCRANWRPAAPPECLHQRGNAVSVNASSGDDAGSMLGVRVIKSPRANSVHPAFNPESLQLIEPRADLGLDRLDSRDNLQAGLGCSTSRGRPPCNGSEWVVALGDDVGLRHAEALLGPGTVGSSRSVVHRAKTSGRLFLACSASVSPSRVGPSFSSASSGRALVVEATSRQRDVVEPHVVGAPSQSA